MFRGKPILAGSSDLNQTQLIFNLMGTPNEENMPGWGSLPGCEGVKSFGYKPGNLHEAFKEYYHPPPPLFQDFLSFFLSFLLLLLFLLGGRRREGLSC